MINKSLRKSSIKQHKYSLDKLKNAIKNNIQLSEFSYTHVLEFDNYLHSLKLSINTIWKHHKNIKKWINQAINEELIVKNPYSNFSVKQKKTSRAFLTSIDIKKIEAVETLSKEMEICKDVFLLQCYTGLRYSDAMYLKIKSIKLQEPESISLEMAKTNKPLFLPIKELFAGAALPIINKYFDHDQEYLFPRQLPNQVYNKTLKAIQQAASIKTSLSSHIGRHSFGTNIALKTGNVFTVMQMMGISKVETAMIYIHLAQEFSAHSLKGVEW